MSILLNDPVANTQLRTCLNESNCFSSISSVNVVFIGDEYCQSIIMTILVGSTKNTSSFAKQFRNKSTQQKASNSRHPPCYMNVKNSRKSINTRTSLLALGRPNGRPLPDSLTPASVVPRKSRPLRFSARVPSACHTRMLHGNCLCPCHHRPPLPAPAIEQRSIPLLPPRACTTPKQLQQVVVIGESYCNMCNIPIYF
jgi:hypothetical protein